MTPLSTGTKCPWQSRLCGLSTLALAAALAFACAAQSGTLKPSAQADEYDPAAALNAAMDVFGEALFASFYEDPLVVSGFQGTLTVSGDLWTFAGYSPDGMLFMDGELVVRKELLPEPTIQGQLVFSGGQDMTMVLDVQIVVQEEEDELPLVGTIEIDGQVHDVRELMQGTTPITAVETLGWGAAKEEAR